MMKKIIILIIPVVSILLPASVSAQTFETSFFLDDYSYAHRINPAFQSDKNVVSVFLGNISANAGSNVGVSNILFPRDGKLVYGLNKKVSSEEFLSGLNLHNHAAEDLSLNLVTVGFWDKSHVAYHTVEINVREYFSTMIPYDMFAFLKNGGTADYDMSGTSADLRGYVDFAYGYSRKIGDKLKVGGRAKFLVGLAGARVNSDFMHVSASEASVSVSARNCLMIAQPVCNVGLDEDGYYDLGSINCNSVGVSGFGAAIDLGVSVEPIEGLDCSFAINDFGGLSWNYNICGQSDGAAEVTNTLDMDPEALAQDFIRFRPADSMTSFDLLPFTVNAGARYKMPFYDRFSVGILGSYHHYHNAPCLNGRLGATISPADWFSFTANCGYGTYGSTAGAMFSITGGCFNFFLGAETYLGRTMADIPAPVDKFRIALNTGMTLRLGGKNKD